MRRALDDSTLWIATLELPIWIRLVQRVIADIGIEVEVILVAYRIRLQKAADSGCVIPGTVIVKPGLRVIPLAREAERLTGGGRTGGEIAVLVIRHLLEHVSGGIRHVDDRALVVHVIVRFWRIGRRAALGVGDPLVDTGAGNVAT